MVGEPTLGVILLQERLAETTREDKVIPLADRDPGELERMRSRAVCT